MPEESFYVKWGEYLVPGMKYLAFLILFLLIYLIFLRPIRRRVSHALSMAAVGAGDAAQTQLSEGTEDALPEGEPPGEIESAADLDADGVLPPVSSGTEGDIPALGPTDEQIEQELLREASMADHGNRKVAAIKKKIVAKAKKDPEMVSQLLRSVLREGM